MSMLAPKTAGQKVIDVLPETPASILDRDQLDGISLDGGDASTAPMTVAAPEPKPNPDDIEEFLETIGRGADSIVIAAHDDRKPSGRQMTAALFRVGDPSMIERIQVRNANKESIFFCAGRVGDDWRGPNPPTIKQIICNPFAWSDVDPRITETPEQAQPRIMKSMLLLVEEQKLPPWSLAVFSGGGFQFLWMGNEAIPPNEIAPRNRYINRLTGGDHTQNCNRLLRVAGTVNWLNAKKRARNRVPTLSRIVREVMA